MVTPVVVMRYQMSMLIPMTLGESGITVALVAFGFCVAFTIALAFAVAVLCFYYAVGWFYAVVMWAMDMENRMNRNIPLIVQSAILNELRYPIAMFLTFSCCDHRSEMTACFMNNCQNDIV